VSGFSIAFKAFIAVCLPSVCGMLVYSDDTSIVATDAFFWEYSFLYQLNEVSCEGSCLIGCWSQMSTYSEMFSVMLLQLETTCISHWIFVNFFKEIKL